MDITALDSIDLSTVAATEPLAAQAVAPATSATSWREPMNGPPVIEDTPGSNGLSNLDNQLSRIINSFSKQLQTLEQSFAHIIRGLRSSIQSAAGALGTQPTRSSTRCKAPGKLQTIISQAAADNQLDPNLLSALISQESGFDSRAVSSAGAMGLTQLMPDTAKSLGVSDPFNPRQNVNGGAHLLRQLIDRYGGRLDLALAAYNAGSGAVDKYGGIPPYAETRNYVRSVLSSYRASALG